MLLVFYGSGEGSGGHLDLPSVLMIIDLPYSGLQKVRVGEMSLAVTQKLTGEQGPIFPHLVMEFFPCLMSSHSVSGRSPLQDWKFVKDVVKLVKARTWLDGDVPQGDLLWGVP